MIIPNLKLIKSSLTLFFNVSILINLSIMTSLLVVAEDRNTETATMAREVTHTGKNVEKILSIFQKNCFFFFKLRSFY